MKQFCNGILVLSLLLPLASLRAAEDAVNVRPLISAERYLSGNKEREEEVIRDLRKIMLEQVQKNARHQRPAHPKGHGALIATFIPEENDLGNPLFAFGKNFEALVRFSNGLAATDRRDLRGISVKIFGVSEDHPIVDLTAINQPLPVSNSGEFLRLIQGSFLQLSKSAGSLLGTLWNGNTNDLLAETYESQSFYKVNDEIAIRFAFEPAQKSSMAFQDKKTDGYLKRRLQARLNALPQDGIIVFNLVAYTFNIATLTTEMLENSLLPAPTPKTYGYPILLARLVIPKQTITPQMQTVDEYMSFNPIVNSTMIGLGSHSRARGIIYEASYAERMRLERERLHLPAEETPVITTRDETIAYFSRFYRE